MTDHNHRYVVIMAGGTGTRLWPLSRNSNPKQFLKLVGDQTLLQSTFEHVNRTVPLKQIYIMADAPKTALAQKQLPKLPIENFLVEPEARDNGPAIVTATLLLSLKDPQAVVAILWSDHFIKKPRQFSRVLEASFSTATKHPDYLVSIGIKPTYPATGFGYIKVGHELTNGSTEPVFKVDAFVEKPDLATATKYVSDWKYLWNTGYKIFSVKHMLELVKQHQPAYHRTLMTIKQELKSGQPAAVLKKHFAEFEKKDIERLITEKTDKILVIPADLGWSDIGAWNVLHDVLVEKEGHDMIIDCPGEHFSINSQRCLVIGKKKLIATVGLEDLVIVETDDALLIAHKSSAQDVKQIVEQLKAANKHEYL